MHQIVEVGGNAGVLGAVRPLDDGQRAAIRYLGLRQTVRGPEQPSQVAEVAGDLRVFGSVRLLVDGQRTAIERLGLRQPVRGLEQLR